VRLKLRGVQIFWIVVTIEVVMAVWLRIAPAITTSKQDAWLSMLVGGFMGVGVTFLAVRVSMLHPGQSLAIFSQKLLGKWLGRLIVLPYVAAWYLLAANVLRTFGDFVHLILLDKTPVWMIMLLMTILMTYITYYCGIQGIARFCEIVGPIIILTLVISFILNVRNVEWKQIFPIYRAGLQKLLGHRIPKNEHLGKAAGEGQCQCCLLLLQYTLLTRA
jgi:spore germination protein KB